MYDMNIYLTYIYYIYIIYTIALAVAEKLLEFGAIPITFSDTSGIRLTADCLFVLI